ncbi:ABC transporter ATP-binding protein [Desulfoluna sp.]|uniref:ABC transporter ATP-binding protein n=1 Tax=Desulfoluna sp. TaxID=2045199 RepID=UPI0026051EB5|nr:ABC transporter ATP-binding protein [Desulfoluna sp.]
MSLTLENVNFTYPGTTSGVFDINLSIGDGELLAVIGSSGSGKTTLLKLIAGFETADRGRILLGSDDITQLPVRNRQLGVVFQTYALFPHMTAWQNVAYPLKIRKVPSETRERKAVEALERVGLQGFENRMPQTLSGGQQQRVALARALVFAPRALLLDEPLSALDASLRGSMRDEIQRLQREFSISTVHITHDQEEALSMADRVAVMEAGRLVQVATPRELYDHPATRSVAAFVGEANLWDGKTVAHDTVELPFGRLTTEPHGLSTGQPVTVLVRPENIGIGKATDGINALTGAVVRDRFLGAIRRFDLSVGPSLVLGQTGIRGPIDSINIRPEHVRLLPIQP